MRPSRKASCVVLYAVPGDGRCVEEIEPENERDVATEDMCEIASEDMCEIAPETGLEDVRIRG